jgi:hypothetical protein
LVTTGKLADGVTVVNRSDTTPVDSDGNATYALSEPVSTATVAVNVQDSANRFATRTGQLLPGAAAAPASSPTSAASSSGESTTTSAATPTPAVPASALKH